MKTSIIFLCFILNVSLGKKYLIETYDDKDDSSSEKYQIDRSDYQAGNGSLVLSTASCQIWKAAFDVCETNNKPGLTWEETSACTLKFKEPIIRDQIPMPSHSLFQKIDVNGDGAVTVEEFKQYRGCASGPSPLLEP